MDQNNKLEAINIRQVLKSIWDRKRLFFIVCAVTFVLSCIYIVGVPRYYTSSAKLAPEISNSAAGGTLGSIASSLGFNSEDLQRGDAINPMLYPDLMEDNGFVTSLFNIQVRSADGEINTTYHDYLQKHQKGSVWTAPLRWLKRLLPKPEGPMVSEQGEPDSYILTKSENDIAEAVRSNITFSIDKKTGVITINTKAQDALICKIIADSVRVRLQAFITEYRTNKARIDYEYYLQLTAKAKEDYEIALKKLARMSDANINVSLHSTRLKIQDMENDMQLKLNTYTSMNTQLEAAKAKVQERTPAFTLLKGAAMPVKAAGPKRMFFVLAMVMLAGVCVSLWILKDILKNDE